MSPFQLSCDLTGLVYVDFLQLSSAIFQVGGFQISIDFIVGFICLSRLFISRPGD